MRIGELLHLLRADGDDTAGELTDLLAELAEPGTRSGATARRHPAAGGLDFHQVSLAEVIRHGLEAMIAAHRGVEVHRCAAREILARQAAAAQSHAEALAAWERSG